MRTCRQPTIKSMFFLMTLVAVLSACIGRMDYLSYLFAYGTSIANTVRAIVITLFFAFLFGPIVTSLFIQRRTVMVVISFVFFIIGFISFMWQGLGWWGLEFTGDDWFFDSFVLIANGLFLPLLCLISRLLDDLDNDGWWMLLPYCLLYLSLGPAFAWTCRLRPPKES